MKKLLLTGFALVSMVTVAQSWTPQGTNFPTSSGVDELDIVDATTAWTFAYDGSGAGTYPKIVSLTTNGGTTWTSKTITGPGANALISDISALSATTAWIVTAPSGAGANANKVYKTTDAGTTWVTQPSGYTAGSFGNQIYFWDANEGFTCGDPLNGKFEMFKTLNGGTTWTPVAGAPAPVGGQGGEFSYVGIKDVVGNNIWIGTDLGRILKSPDRGVTWTANFSPALDFGGVTTPGSSATFTFKSATAGLLLTVDGATVGGTPTSALYSTADGGTTWDPINPVGPWYFGDITHVPGTANTYVSTGINSSSDAYLGSSYSTDGGLTWTAIDSALQRGKVEFFSPTVGWAGQFVSATAPTTTGILKFNGNLALAVSDASTKSALKVYPNPAVDVVNVTAKQDIKSVTVIDLSGKKVQSFQGGKNINVSSLAKGTYILQVYFGNGAVENTKLIKK